MVFRNFSALGYSSGSGYNNRNYYDWDDDEQPWKQGVPSNGINEVDDDDPYIAANKSARNIYKEHITAKSFDYDDFV